MAHLDKLEAAHGGWVIRTDLVIGVAAWRRTSVPAARLGRDGVNAMVAANLDELGDKLAEQDRIPGTSLLG